MAPADTSATHKRMASATPEASEPPPEKSHKIHEEKDSQIAAKDDPTVAPANSSDQEKHKQKAKQEEDKQLAEPEPRNLKLTYHQGDIFDCPEATVLIHACNTQGSWGAGIAAAFRTKYPEAFKIYRDYCLVKHKPATNPVPTGTCLLISPCEKGRIGLKRHYIACLFTSAKYGKGKDKPDIILQNTGPAMQDLLKQLKEVNEGKAEEGEEKLVSLRMCKINSARFGVRWERTVEVLEGVTVPEGCPEFATIEVWDR